MGFATIAGWLISGFATRLYAGGIATWIALEAVKPLKAASTAVTATLGQLQ